MLFFKCMAALFNPLYRRGDLIKWGLVSYTVAMSLLVTIGTATQLDVQSISYIDNRQFPGVKGVLPPGPTGYQSLITTEAITVIENVPFVLNNWLAEGLLVSALLMLYSFTHVVNADSFSFIVATLSTP